MLKRFFARQWVKLVGETHPHAYGGTEPHLGAEFWHKHRLSRKIRNSPLQWHHHFLWHSGEVRPGFPTLTETFSRPYLWVRLGSYLLYVQDVKPLHWEYALRLDGRRVAVLTSPTELDVVTWKNVTLQANSFEVVQPDGVVFEYEFTGMFASTSGDFTVRL